MAGRRAKTNREVCRECHVHSGSPRSNSVLCDVTHTACLERKLVLQFKVSRASSSDTRSRTPTNSVQLLFLCLFRRPLSSLKQTTRPRRFVTAPSVVPSNTQSRHFRSSRDASPPTAAESINVSLVLRRCSCCHVDKFRPY